MIRPNPGDKSDRFKGSLRHYHRTGAKPTYSWDEWINGKATKPRSTKWLKILGFVIALLALGGIIAGLIIELR